MLFALLRYYAKRPWRINDLAILHHFRAEREKRAGYAIGNLEQAQYEWCADKGDYTISRIKQVVDFWMFNFPNKYLHACMYPGVKAFIDTLRQHQIKIGIYSDYKAADKLKAMHIEADIVVCSTDEKVDQLKPSPEGLLHIAQKLGLKPEECLFIGDRQELDGECAIRANMPYLIVDKKPFSKFDFYHKLTLPLAQLVA